MKIIQFPGAMNGIIKELEEFKRKCAVTSILLLLRACYYDTIHVK